MKDTVKRWVAVTCDGNAQWRIFYKWIDESDSAQIDSFQHEVESKGVHITTMYREEDVISHCIL